MLRFLSRGLGGGAPIFVTRVRGGCSEICHGETRNLNPPLPVIVEHSLREEDIFLYGGTRNTAEL